LFVEVLRSLAAAVPALLADADARAGMAANAARLLEEGRGALARTVALVEPALPRA
jgi:3-deoxy-D-manno-octulosonic-acid transferase